MASNLICRQTSPTGDWMFGAGKNNYVQNLAEVSQDIGMNLRSFLGDCFFAKNQGVDWFNLLGQIGPQAQLALNLAVNAAILNTTGVTGIKQTSLTVQNRVINIQYVVTTVYSTLTGQFSFDTSTLA